MCKIVSFMFDCGNCQVKGVGMYKIGFSLPTSAAKPIIVLCKLIGSFDWFNARRSNICWMNHSMCKS